MDITTIDTRQGTDNSRNFSNGNCLPYTGVPFGMNYICPQTSSDERWWFNPLDHVFQGFRITHQPSPWMGDFSSILMLPISGDMPDSIEKAQTSYRPERSVFSPVKLSIYENQYGIESTVIPSTYGGILDVLYTYNEKNGLMLKVTGKSQFLKVNDNRIEGYVINFAGCEDKELKFYLTLQLDVPIKELKKEPDLLKVTFEKGSHQTVRFGTSFISSEQASLNLEREVDQTIDQYEKYSSSKWQKLFDKVKITHHDHKPVNTFYHNLYRSFLFPQRFYELNQSGHEIHYDTVSKTIKDGVLFTNNGYWDTYKTVYPWFSIVIPELFEQMMKGILNFYKDTGYLPRWTSPDERGLMPGTLVDAVIADGITKGIGTSIAADLFKAMEDNASKIPNHAKYGRKAIKEYSVLGYVPDHFKESVNETLDYAYSDFCIARVAETIGEVDKANQYFEKSLNYHNLFNQQVGFMRAKSAGGDWKAHFDEHKWGEDYAEGSAWQSSFSVYHDFNGLITDFGGKDEFEVKLKHLFNQKPVFKTDGYGEEIHEMSEMASVELGQFALSNQPSFHYPFLASYIGKPEMTQPLLKTVMSTLFDTSYQGFPGDEDNGSMATWYLFNSLGFYPVTPGSSEYVIGMPLFDEVIIELPDQKKLKIETAPNEAYNLFIDHVCINQKEHLDLFFDHKTIMSGGTISFILGSVPTIRKDVENHLPFSLSNYFKKNEIQ